MSNRGFSFVNIVPISSGAEFAVSEIRRQYKDVGLTKFALMLSFHPTGTPATDNANRIIATAKQVMDELRNDPITVGILFQSTLGHGWSGRVALTNEPWQRIVKNDGALTSRMCLFDKGFQDYILYVVEESMKLDPKFLIMDDDFGLRRGECFCPKCVDLFNQAAAKEFGCIIPRSAKELIELVETRPEDDPEVVLLAKIRHQGLIDFAKDIRNVIDKYNDSISCTQCTSGGAHGWISELVHTLAGEKGMPSVRVNNAIYCINQPLHLLNLTSQTYKIKNCYENVPEIIAEADTCPQTYWAENASLFHAHLTNDALCGLTGAKIWISEFENDHFTGYFDKFEYYLKNYRGFYNELRDTVKNTTYQGIHHLLVMGDYASMTHPLNASYPSYQMDWNMTLMGTFAFPLAYDNGTGDGIYALCEPSVRFATDEQLKEIFRKKVLIDSKAAKLLTARGFAKYMGVQTVEDPSFFFTHELDENNHIWPLMWEPDMAKLECISDKTEVKTISVCAEGHKTEVKKVSPCMTFFTNELGGRVATLAWTHEFTLLKVWRRSRRNMLMEATKFLNGGVQIDMLLDAQQQVLVRHGKIGDGAEELVALISVSLDKIPEIKLSMSRPVYGVKQLLADGSWEDVSFSCDNQTLKVDLSLEIVKPVILKLKTQK